MRILVNRYALTRGILKVHCNLFAIPSSVSMGIEKNPPNLPIHDQNRHGQTKSTVSVRWRLESDEKEKQDGYRANGVDRSKLVPPVPRLFKTSTRKSSTRFL
jgi:hypothetical protein